MKTKNILIFSFCVLLLFNCNSKNVLRVQLFENYEVNWDNDKRWIIEDEDFEKLKKDFKNTELKLIVSLLDTTPIIEVCFKDKPLRKGDIALVCLIEIGTLYKLYDSDMLEVKRLDHNEPCYFVYYNNFYHLENNRQKYYNYIKNNKVKEIRD
jgi:hypothetical protein